MLDILHHAYSPPGGTMCLTAVLPAPRRAQEYQALHKSERDGGRQQQYPKDQTSNLLPLR